MSASFTTSVVIPCHNAGKTLDLQLESLAQQRGTEPFEVIVVDNKSTDDTCEVAERWSKQLNLRLVTASAHTGVAYARNVGARFAQGQKLIFLDCDDATPADYVAFGQRSLEIVPVYVAGFDPIAHREFSGGLEHVLALIADKCLEYQDPLPSEQDPNWPILPGCSFGILKSLFIEIGGFDSATEPGAEDNDLAIRLMDAGYSLPVQRSTTIAYRFDDESLRPLGMYLKRAQSVALLLTYSNRWAYYQGKNGHPLLAFVKSIFAGLKVLSTPGQTRRWLNRVFTSAGIARGYLEYRVLKKLPDRRLGLGLGLKD